MTQHCHLVPIFILSVHILRRPGPIFFALFTATQTSRAAVDEPFGAVCGSLIPLMGSVATIEIINSRLDRFYLSALVRIVTILSGWLFKDFGLLANKF